MSDIDLETQFVLMLPQKERFAHIRARYEGIDRRLFEGRHHHSFEWLAWQIGMIKPYLLSIEPSKLVLRTIHMEGQTITYNEDIGYLGRVLQTYLRLERYSLKKFMNNLNLLPLQDRLSSRVSRTRISKAKAWRCHSIEVERVKRSRKWVEVCDCTTSRGAVLCNAHGGNHGKD